MNKIIDNINDIETIVGKQDTLTSGTTIKTINGTSVLGSGDILIALDTTDLQTEINNFQVGAGLRLDGLYSQSSVVVSNIYEHPVSNQYINAIPYNTKTVVCNLILNFIETPLIEYNAVRDKQTGEIFKFEDGFVNHDNGIEFVIFDISIIKNQDYYVYLNFDPYIDLPYTPLDLNIRYVELVKVHYIIDEFNYINGAISLYDADKKLDTQLKLLSDSKQDTLVSGENIKTINGASILGSGNIDISAGAVLDKHVFVATAGQTEFTVAYTVGLLEVYRNGFKLTSDLYTATNGTSVVLSNACLVNDVVEAVVYTSFDVVNTYTIAQVDAELATKQDVLVSGVGIKTVNSQSLLGSGDVVIDTSDKLSLSGGTMTGAITGLKETSVAMGASNIDLATGNLFTKTISGATTLTISNAPTSGLVGYFILQLTNAGSGAITWFSGVKWAGGTAPTLTASGKDILSFYSIDGGTTWNVINIQKDVK